MGDDLSQERPARDGETAIDAIAKQHERIRTEIAHHLNAVERGLAFGLAVVGATAAFADRTSDVAWLVLPAGLLVAFLYGYQHMLEVFVLGGYARLLEKRLNELASEPVWLWEEHLVSRVHKALGGRALAPLYLLTIAWAMYLGGEPLWHGWNRPFLAVAGVGTAAVLVISQRQLNQAARESYSDALTAYELEREHLRTSNATGGADEGAVID